MTSENTRELPDTVENAAATPDQDMPWKELGLKEDEYQRICDILGRRPTNAELAMYSVMWSEHCSYKSSKKHLAEQFGARTTDAMRKNLLVGMGQNAGVVDIGGGSTELVLGATRVEQAISIDMGAVRVTEKFFSHVDPAGGVPVEDQERAIAWIDEQLDRAEKSVDLARVRSLVGVAGTVTTLTAQALGLTSYQPERIHGARLSAAQFEEAVRFMVDQPTSVKASLGFMPEGREDVIAAGALIWSRIVTRVLDRAEAAGHPI